MKGECGWVKDTHSRNGRSRLKTREIVQLLHAGELHLLVVVDLHAAHADTGVHHRPHVDPGGPIALARDPVRRPGEVGRVDVGGDALVEPVELVRTDEVHLAAQHGVVVPVPQVVGQRRHRRRHLDGVVPHGDGVGVAAGQHRHARRHAQREVAVRVLEDRPALGEPLQVGGPDQRMPVERQRPRGHLVRLDDEDVGCLAWHRDDRVGAGQARATGWSFPASRSGS